MTHSHDSVTRREALRRTALLVGGTLAASSILGAERSAWAAETAAPGWAARTLSAQELAMVATIAEHIIPATDTPGARGAGVHRFIDVLLTDYYGASERDRFLAGLRETNTRAMRTHRAPFLRCSSAEQLALLTALDAEAFPPKVVRMRPPAAPTTAVSPALRDSLTRPGATVNGSVQPASAATDAAPDAARTLSEAAWFFQRIKELTLLGYYTSDVGANKELRTNPMGYYRADLPYASIGRSWA